MNELPVMPIRAKYADETTNGVNIDDAIDTLETTVGDSTAGLVKKVSDLEDKTQKISYSDGGTSVDGNLSATELGSTHAKVFENIEDSAGHKRFVEGNGSTAQIEGLNITFCKWSLSGSHLMLVLAGTVALGTTITSSDRIAVFPLPSWVNAKIYPVLSNLIEYKNISFINMSTYQQNNVMGYIDKLSDGISLYIMQSITFEADSTFRVVFDLLIDNE